MTPGEVLTAAANLIERCGWTKGASARDYAGFVVRTDSIHATCWCMTGAVERIIAKHSDIKSTERGKLRRDTRARLAAHLGVEPHYGPERWNDKQTASKTVSDMLRAAGKEKE